MKKLILGLILLMINNILAQEIETVNINELATRDLKSSDFLIKGEESFIYKNTLRALSNFIESVGVLGYKGGLGIADSPVEDGFYFASENGEYINAGGLVIDMNEGLNIISITQFQTVFEKFVYPINVDLTKINSNFSDISEFVNKNLFNDAEIVRDRYLNNNGDIQAAAGWARSGNISVTPGKTYTLSGLRSRIGIAFYTSTEGFAMPGSYNASENPVTVTAPEGAVFAAFNIYTSTQTEYSHLQFEEGVEPTFYVPFGGQYFIKKNAIPSLETSLDSLILDIDFTGASNTIIDVYSELGNFKQEVVPFRPLTRDDSQSFDFRKTYYNGSLIHNMSDECAPYRVGWTVGANHGYSRSRITSPSHGKSNVDVGSVWSDGSDEYVIIGIPDSNTIDITARSGNGFLLANSINHVSGATNNSSINTSSKINEDFFPGYKDRSIKVYADDVEIIKSGSHTARTSIIFKESYNIMDKDSMVEWLITQVGASNEIIEFQGTPILRANITYQFNRYGVCTIYTDLIALVDIPQLQDIMFNMNNKLEEPYDLYVPKSLPFTHEGDPFNLTNPTDISGYSWSTRLDLSPSRVESTGILSDRALMLKNNVGFALGFLPLRDAGVVERRENITRKALQISNTTKKIYMSAIDSEDITSMSKGDSFSVIAYKAYFPITNNATDIYFVESKDAVFMYADWHTPGIKTIDVPSAYIGLNFSVVEKSVNVTLLGIENNCSITVDLNTGEYGYLILKMTKS